MLKLLAASNLGGVMSDLEIVKAGAWALDVLEAAGLNESAAADAIRDRLDRPWHRLGDAQREEFRCSRGQRAG